MEIKTVQLQDFKRVHDVEILLSDINVVVGGNNSGKSSVLQGIHFSAGAERAAREAGGQTFPQDRLLYCPTSDFTCIRHGDPYRNHRGMAESHLVVTGVNDSGEDVRRETTIYRGRNYANVGCRTQGDRALGNALSNVTEPFSVYVPGLAGIPETEEARARAIVDRGVAGGEANLYLRNVLRLINEADLLDELVEQVRQVFPAFDVHIDHDPEHDPFISVTAMVTPDTGSRPLELAGTGCLQALQIFSYLTLYKPRLLLLDEPDAHLHPDNQRLLASTLMHAASSSGTKIVLATHSRTLVRALSSDANFIWLKDGEVYKHGRNLDMLPLLMDIGALDDFDRLQSGDVSTVVLTEDTDTKYMEVLLQVCDAHHNDVLIFPYHGSARISEAQAIACFLRDHAADCKYIIHADRDFMSDAEYIDFADKYGGDGVEVFVTDRCDIESYFTDPAHVAELLDVDQGDVTAWMNDLAQQDHNALLHAFLRKRDNVKATLYKGRQDNAPSSRELVGSVIPLPPEKRVGKKMLSLMRDSMHDRWGKVVNLIQLSGALDCPTLKECLSA